MPKDEVHGNDDPQMTALLDDMREKRGEKTKELYDLIPYVMQELIQRCIENPDVRVRERHKVQLRALTTFSFADTVFPPKGSQSDDRIETDPL